MSTSSREVPEEPRQRKPGLGVRSVGSRRSTRSVMRIVGVIGGGSGDPAEGLKPAVTRSLRLGRMWSYAHWCAAGLSTVAGLTQLASAPRSECGDPGLLGRLVCATSADALRDSYSDRRPQSHGQCEKTGV